MGSNHRWRALGLSLGLTLGAGHNAVADDTEVLVGQFLDPGNPNILFIIDTSGSMATETDAIAGYDAGTVFDGACAQDYVYFVPGDDPTTLPDCSADQKVQIDLFTCLGAEPGFQATGLFRDRYSQWNPITSQWGAVLPESMYEAGETRYVECRSDYGLHGLDESAVFPGNGASSGPWSNLANSGFWDDTGETLSFYTGNYLNFVQAIADGTVIQTRMDVVKRVATEVLSASSGINVGVMRFSTNGDGGMVLKELVNLDTNRDMVIDTIESLGTQGNTPLSETLYESALYYRGEGVDYGLDSVGEDDSLLPSVDTSRTGDVYDNPITGRCQKNYVVLLTDGLPTEDDPTAKLGNLPGFTGGCTDNCLDEISAYLDTTDHRAGSGFEGDQTVQLFTIGFNTDQDLLAAAATGSVPDRDEDGNLQYDENGDLIERPGYFTAGDQSELLGAFTAIVDAIQSQGDSFTAPAVSVNSANRLTHLDDLYFTLFRPSPRGQPHWDGNLKKYKLGVSGSELDIIDARGEVAVNPDGTFVDGSRSFWSAEPDEGDVEAGGFAGTLQSTTRNVVTNLVEGANGSADLGVDGNAVSMDNDLLITELGLPIDEVDEVVHWAQGLTADATASRQEIGDPLHSEPVVITYADGNFGLFFGTNDGFLHGIDPSREDVAVDIEKFAFIPRELLHRLDELQRNEPGENFDKTYGMDGPLTYWIKDDDGDRVVESGERALLYAAMRRGGNSYYALDVTDPDDVDLEWRITGGSGDFVELAQSWSRATPGKIDIDGTVRDVLFFGGGNDTNKDSRDRPASPDSRGRAVYIVDAETGDRIFWASSDGGADLVLADMVHAIPGDLRVLDIDGDGLQDRLYFADTGGQVWRMDIDNGAPLAQLVSGAVLARLADATGESGNRRVYTAPSIGRITDNERSFLTVSVGTGHRAHPLETDVDDAFYVIRDPNVFAPPRDPVSQLIEYPEPLTPADLVDITDVGEPDPDQIFAQQGWFIRFAGGEKNLTASTTVLNRILFTTYQPSSLPLSCDPVEVQGRGRLYALDVVTGLGVIPAELADDPDNRFIDLDAGGIPPSPILVFSDEFNDPNCDECPASEIAVVTGTQIDTLGELTGLGPNVARRTYWYQVDVERE